MLTPHLFHSISPHQQLHFCIRIESFNLHLSDTRAVSFRPSNRNFTREHGVRQLPVYWVITIAQVLFIDTNQQVRVDMPKAEVNRFEHSCQNCLLRANNGWEADFTLPIGGTVCAIEMTRQILVWNSAESWRASNIMKLFESDQRPVDDPRTMTPHSMDRSDV